MFVNDISGKFGLTINVTNYVETGARLSATYRQSCTALTSSSPFLGGVESRLAALLLRLPNR